MGAGIKALREQLDDTITDPNFDLFTCIYANLIKILIHLKHLMASFGAVIF
jgi:hypothetical protein